MIAVAMNMNLRVNMRVVESMDTEMNMNTDMDMGICLAWHESQVWQRNAATNEGALCGLQ
jgi:hypothetical protein